MLDIKKYAIQFTNLFKVFNIPKKFVFPVLVLTLGYKVDGKWKWGDIKFGHSGDESLFYNGILCIRIMLPFFIGIGFRWAGSNPTVREFLHTLVGWKLSGSIAVEFRIQSDESSSSGYTSPNNGQAWGWNKGNK